MPRATLSIARIGRLLGRPIAREELTERLFASKTQAEGGVGDALEVEGTADRLDLLTESGIALHLQGDLGVAVGRPRLREASGPALRIEVAPSVGSLRPAIAGVVVAPPSGGALDADLLDEAIRFQEQLHATIGLDRRLASLGIYPLERIVGPVRYALEPLDDVRFVPLDGITEQSAADFYAAHPMAERYGRYGRDGDACLTLRDAAGSVLSLPPVLNARPAGEAAVGDAALLLESTGTRASRVLDAVALLTLVFATRGWSVAPVEVAPTPPDGPAPSPVATRRLELPRATLAELMGERLDDREVATMLGRARFDARPQAEGWAVEAAPWRVDLHAAVDVVEDLLIARGFRVEEGILPASTGRGRRSRSAGFRARVGDLLLGLGYVPLYSTVLVSERIVSVAQRPRTLALANPVSEQFARMRDALSLSLLAALERNVRHAYPQRFSEVGPVVVGASDAETGADTRHHAGVLYAAEGAGFADGAAVVDYLMRTLGAVGVREPAPLPGTIPGRAALVRLAGVVVAELGEVAPTVLTELRVPVPAVWAEVDLTALERLLAPDRAEGAAP